MFNQISNAFVINAQGLAGTTENLLSNWVAPVFILVVGAMSLYFLFNREIRKLLVFFAIAALVGALIFFADDIFGQNGSMSKFVKEEAVKINTILPTDVTTSDHIDITDFNK